MKIKGLVDLGNRRKASKEKRQPPQEQKESL